MQIHSLNEKVTEEKQRSKLAENSLAVVTTEASTLKVQISQLETELKSKSERKRAIVQDLNSKMKQIEEKLHQTQNDLQLSQMEKKQLSETLQQSHSSEKKQLEALENKLIEYKKSKSRLSVDLDNALGVKAKLQAELTEIRGSSQSIESTNELLTIQVKTLTDRVKKLNEIIVELKGSIRVFCRVRPVTFTEDCTHEDIAELVRYPDYNHIDFKKSMVSCGVVRTMYSS